MRARVRANVCTRVRVCVRACVRMRVRGAGARAGALYACVFLGGRGVASRANTVSPFANLCYSFEYQNR